MVVTTKIVRVRPCSHNNVIHLVRIGIIRGSLVPRLSVKREMWGRKGEPGFYCTHGRVNFDHIIIFILNHNTIDDVIIK